MTRKLVGDKIEDALRAVGITDERVSQWLKEPCNCKERRDKLNQLDLWATRVLKGWKDKAVQYLSAIIDQEQTMDTLVKAENKAPPYKIRTTCRVCNSTSLEVLFSLGYQYISDFVPLNYDYGQAIQVPITMVLCRNCTLAQLLHTAPQDFLYTRHYWYRSGVTDTMRLALRDITKDIEERIELTATDVVLDIGSNDGTLLRSYSKPCYKVGVEPAKNLKEEGSVGIDLFIPEFWEYKYYGVPDKAKVITAIGMFYDLEDPNQFIADVAQALDPNGIFVAQLMCLNNMLEMNDIGNLAHEHLEYYSLQSLIHLYSKHGLEVFDITLNETNGSSYRIFARRTGSIVGQNLEATKHLEEVKLTEQSAQLDRPEAYLRFFERVYDAKKETTDFIWDKVKDQRKVWIYGASTKGNVILQYYGLDDSLIAGAAERSPEKYGKKTIGTNIPIFSEEHAREVAPDYFFVLPYSFINEFVTREKQWRDNGGKFIVSIPKFQVV